MVFLCNNTYGEIINQKSGDKPQSQVTMNQLNDLFLRISFLTLKTVLSWYFQALELF